MRFQALGPSNSDSARKIIVIDGIPRSVRGFGRNWSDLVLYVSVLNRRQALKGHEAIVEEAVVEEAVVEEAVAEQAVVEEAVVVEGV